MEFDQKRKKEDASISSAGQQWSSGVAGPQLERSGGMDMVQTGSSESIPGAERGMVVEPQPGLFGHFAEDGAANATNGMGSKLVDGGLDILRKLGSGLTGGE